MTPRRKVKPKPVKEPPTKDTGDKAEPEAPKPVIRLARITRSAKGPK